MDKKEVSIIHYLSVFVEWRKFLIINFLIVCFIAAGISLSLPKWYTSMTTILPPTGESGDMGLSSLIGNLPLSGFGLGIGAISEQTNTFLAILNSRTVMEAVANKFNLMERYKTKNMEETVKTLRDRISVEVNEDGTISLFAQAKTSYFPGEKDDNEAKELAKDIANYFIEQLNEVNTKLKVEKAKNTRIFIERRYQQNLEDLKSAEEEFRQFQKKYGAVALPEQTAAVIKAAAELKAEIIAKEVEIGVLGRYVSDSHANLLQAQAELSELNKKYKEFKYGENFEKDKNATINYSKDFFLPFEDIPDIGVKYIRLFRDVTLQEKLLEFLLPQYEQAKIQEARDTPTVQVLDPAVKPERKSKPKRMLIVLFAGFMTLAVAAMVGYINVNFDHLKVTDPDRYEQINKLIHQLKPKNWFK